MTENDPFGFTGLTYDDVLLLPGQSDVLPSQVSTKTQVTKRLSIGIPLLSSEFFCSGHQSVGWCN